MLGGLGLAGGEPAPSFGRTPTLGSAPGGSRSGPSRAGSIDRFGALLGFSPEPATPYVRAESFGAALFEETITSPLNVGTTPFKS